MPDNLGQKFKRYSPAIIGVIAIIIFLIIRNVFTHDVEVGKLVSKKVVGVWNSEEEVLVHVTPEAFTIAFEVQSLFTTQGVDTPFDTVLENSLITSWDEIRYLAVFELSKDKQIATYRLTRADFNALSMNNVARFEIDPSQPDAIKRLIEF